MTPDETPKAFPMTGSTQEPLKSNEALESARCVEKGHFMFARLDGRAFSAFTQPMAKPFDADFTRAMIDTTTHVMKALSPNIAFTQSDEMTFCWFQPVSSESEYPFGGRLQKICSLSASIASCYFYDKMRLLADKYCHGPNSLRNLLDNPPVFDARVWAETSTDAAVEAFLAREADCRRNAVSMVAYSFISPKKLMKVSTKDRLKMLKDMGVNYEKYPFENRYGTYVIRKKVERLMTEEELLAIPEEHRKPDHTVTKTEYARAEFSSLNNEGVGVLPLIQSVWTTVPYSKPNGPTGPVYIK